MAGITNQFALSFSGGKDSVLALHRLIGEGRKPACLLTSYNEAQQRSWFHGIPLRMLQETAECLNLPLKLVSCGEGEDYNAAFESALKELRAQNVASCAFGDIDIPAHREWCETRCAAVGMEALLPLWNQAREAVVMEFLEAGFQAVLKNVRLSELNESFLGRSLSVSLLEELRQRGVDVCGENGEYHTVVVDGPLFCRPVPLQAAGVLRTATHAFLVLK